MSARCLNALSDNKTAVKVGEKYLADSNAPMGVYRLGYCPHNVHFVMASTQMAGDTQIMIAAAEKLRELILDEAARGIALVQAVKAAPYFAHAQSSSPKTILALPDPGDAIPVKARRNRPSHRPKEGKISTIRGGDGMTEPNIVRTETCKILSYRDDKQSNVDGSRARTDRQARPVSVERGRGQDQLRRDLRG